MISNFVPHVRYSISNLLDNSNHLIISFYSLKALAVKVKLTLTLDENVKIKAKAHAMRVNIRLSVLIENYLRNLPGDIQISPKLERITGSVELPPDFDEKSSLSDYFDDKHL